MDKNQKDMCPFSYWRAREANSESAGKFHPEKKKICASSIEACT